MTLILFGFPGWVLGIILTPWSLQQSKWPGWPNPPWSTYLLRRLLENSDYRNRFINIFPID